MTAKVKIMKYKLGRVVVNKEAHIREANRGSIEHVKIWDD